MLASYLHSLRSEEPKVCVYTQMHALAACSSRIPCELRKCIWTMILRRMSHSFVPDGLARPPIPPPPFPCLASVERILLGFLFGGY